MFTSLSSHLWGIFFEKDPFIIPGIGQVDLLGWSLHFYFFRGSSSLFYPLFRIQFWGREGVKWYTHFSSPVIIVSNRSSHSALYRVRNWAMAARRLTLWSSVKIFRTHLALTFFFPKCLWMMGKMVPCDKRITDHILKIFFNFGDLYLHILFH